MQKQEIEEDGISLGQLFGVMLGRKLLLLIITLSVFILGTIVFKFAYNDNKEVYSVQFKYSDQSLLNSSYLDGTNFNYRDVISKSNLSSIKASSDSYSNIDIDSMYDEGDIGIQYYTTYVVINSQETATIDDRYYTLVVKAKYFSNEDQAKEFLNSLISSPIRKNETIINNSDYTSNLKLYNTATTYEDQILFLQSQLSFIQNSYANLIQTYGNVTISNGVTLQNVLNEINATFQTTTLNSLEQEVTINGYVKDPQADYMNQLIVTQADLYRRIEIAGDNLVALTEQRDAILDSLQGTTMQQIDISSYNEQIIALTLQISDLNKEYDDVTKKVNSLTVSSEQENFITRLNKYYTQLNDFTTNYKSNQLEVVRVLSSVDYYSTSIVVSSGTINILLAAVVFLVLGFVGACCVNLILDGKKLSKYYVPEPKKENE